MTRALLAGCVMLALAFAMGTPHLRQAERTQAVLDSDPRLNALLRRACANCHTNETAWPWYGWLVEHDVAKARAKLNLSTGLLSLATQRQEVVDAVADGVMPPLSYRLFHPEARLSAQDRQTLAEWARRGR